MNTNYMYSNPYSSKQIQFNIYLTIGQALIATGNLNQTFQSVVDNTFQINNILHLKKHIHGAVLEANKISFRKTLLENGIYQGMKKIIQDERKGKPAKKIEKLFDKNYYEEIIKKIESII